MQYWTIFMENIGTLPFASAIESFFDPPTLSMA
jgi:hypothetical protein